MTSSLERNPETLAIASTWKQELLSHLRRPGIHAASTLTFHDAVQDGLIGGASNIIGVGYGIRAARGKNHGEDRAVIVYVREKRPNHELSFLEKIPSVINGQPTDVIAVGNISAGSARDTHNPTECGVSGAHRNVYAGTIGCVIRVDGNQTDHILSCNHVFADSNNAAMGDPIFQAAPGDCGTLPIATLADYEPLSFTSGSVNRIDAAIGSVENTRTVLPTIRRIGAVGPPVAASAGLNVRKHGRTTGLTTGTVFDISADIGVGYSGSRHAFFEDQLAVQGDASADSNGDFGQPGDSGSLVVNDTCNAIGLLFAVASQGGIGYANPIGAILRRFAATII